MADSSFYHRSDFAESNIHIGLTYSVHDQSPDPTSPFARWLIEQDERFFQTFPDARYAANQWAQGPLPHSAFLHGIASSSSARSSSSSLPRPPPPPPTSTADADMSNNHFYGDAVGSVKTLEGLPIVRSSSTTITIPLPSYKQLSASPTHWLDPIPKTESSPYDQEAPMDFLPFPTSPTSPTHVSSPASSSCSTYIDEVNSPVVDIDDDMDAFPKLTRRRTTEAYVTSTPWASDLASTSRRLIAPAPRYPSTEEDDGETDTAPTHASRPAMSSPPRTYRKLRKPSRAASLPHTHGSGALPHGHGAKHSIRPLAWSSNRSPSPRSSPIRLSPTLRKQPADKKPPLACLFCRGRKIACGPPLPGSKDKACNQCQRRQLKCEYPLESRRGMRKKKTAPTKMNADGVKVTVVVKSDEEAASTAATAATTTTTMVVE